MMAGPHVVVVDSTQNQNPIKNIWFISVASMELPSALFSACLIKAQARLYHRQDPKRRRCERLQLRFQPLIELWYLDTTASIVPAVKPCACAASGSTSSAATSVTERRLISPALRPLRRHRPIPREIPHGGGNAIGRRAGQRHWYLRD